MPALALRGETLDVALNEDGHGRNFSFPARAAAPTDFPSPEGAGGGALRRAPLRPREAISTTVLADENQTAPAFFFPNVAAARGFPDWIEDHFAHLKAAAEATTRHGKLKNVKCYQEKAGVFPHDPRQR